MQLAEMKSKIAPLLGKKWAKPLLYTAGIAFCANWFWCNSAIFTVGSGNLATKYSYSDVENYYKTDSRIAQVMGTPVIESRKQAFIFLAMAGLEKEILKAKDVNVVRDNALALVENRTALRGLMADVKRSIGQDAYYRIVVEPLVVSELFASYYRINDPNRKIAEKMLADAAASGIDAAAKTAGYTAKEMAIPAVMANAAFVEESKQYVGKVFPKMLEDGAGYSVAQIKELRQGAVIVTAAQIPRKPIFDFIKDELKASSIPYSFRPYSIYRESDLVKAFNATTQKTGEKANGKAEDSQK